MIDGIDGLRGAEMVVMGIAVEHHPKAVSVSFLLEEMKAEDPSRRSARDQQAQAAITGSVEVGLLVRLGDSVEPTAAGLRSVQLQLYL